MTAERITSYTHDGLRFDVTDVGPLDGQPEKKAPVVLLHGFPQRATCWDRVTPVLNEAGYRTLAPDQRGYSPGARPRGRAAYRVRNLVGDVVALIDRVGGPVHLVAHDWGAAVGWALALAHPDRLLSYTAVSVPHPAAMIGAMRHGQAKASWYMGFFQLPLIPELGLRSRAIGRRSMRRARMSPESYERFRREIVEDGALRGGLGWYRALPLSRKESGAFGRARITVPTTMVWSDRDGFLVRHGIEHTGDFVDAPYALEVLQGVSHWIPEDEPELLARAILDRAGAPA